MNIGKYLTKENKSRALKLRGLPFNTTEDEIMEFLKKYNLVMGWVNWVRKNLGL